MPDRQIERLRVFLEQGAGKHSECAQQRELAALTEPEGEQLQAL